MDWEKSFTDIGALWFHDGNPKRPYARLTAGGISNGFFNGEIVARQATLFGKACEAIAGFEPFPKDNRRSVVIGAAMGAIKIAGRIAEALDFETAYAEKEGDLLVFKRTVFAPGERFVLSEDVTTKGTTLRKLKQAAELASPGCTFSESILTFCNRTKHGTRWGDKITIPGHSIFALVNRPMPEWEEGNNPFTSDGKELIPPLRPKGKENWDALTRSYE